MSFSLKNTNIKNHKNHKTTNKHSYKNQNKIKNSTKISLAYSPHPFNEEMNLILKTIPHFAEWIDYPRWKIQVIRALKLRGIFNFRNPAWNPFIDNDGYMICTENISCIQALTEISNIAWFPDILRHLDSVYESSIPRKRCNFCESPKHRARECPSLILKRKQTMAIDSEGKEAHVQNPRSIRKPKWDSGSSTPIWRKKVSKKVSPTALSEKALSIAIHPSQAAKPRGKAECTDSKATKPFIPKICEKPSGTDELLQKKRDRLIQETLMKSMMKGMMMFAEKNFQPGIHGNMKGDSFRQADRVQLEKGGNDVVTNSPPSSKRSR